MVFKEGDLVEVLRSENDLCGSWFSGKIIAIDGDSYIVRYKLLADHKGEPVLEKVHEEDVRPQPPHDKGKRWMVGNITEVFDVPCWRVGKVAKVLNDDYFVIKLFGSIQLKEFHQSNLRIRQAWNGSKWSMIEKISPNKQNNAYNSIYSRSFVCRAPRQVICEETSLQEKDGQEFFMNDGHNGLKKFPHRKAIKRKHSYCLETSSKNLLMKDSREKRKSSLNAGQSDESFIRILPFLKQVDDISSSGPVWSSEGSNHCSVASFSLKEFPEYPDQNSPKSSRNIFDSSDTESSFPSPSGQKRLNPSPEDKIEVDIHKLELRAYQSTVQAFYASGPLSWEQESLLTNLRMSLHISNEEHLLQLRHLLSAQVR
uniref:ENT domain-containing protein n=1 Tax=Davidia involucrata TaxID=16924 RepID=A0A5B7BNZ1_DAVIN